MKSWLSSLPTSRILLFLTVPLLLYFGFSMGSWALREYQQRQEEARLRQEIETEKARYDALQAQRKYFQSDEYVEKVAREELNLIKSGEAAVVVLAPTPAAQPGEEVPLKSKKTERPNWQRWWDVFFGS
ncbi:MAG: septum formation initiator family protein [Chloroflexota bacterium]